MNVQRIRKITQSEGYHILPVKHGMQLEIHEEVGEGDNKRTRRFKGLVIKVKNPMHPSGTFTIRGKTSGHTIEKIYPLSFRKFQKVLLLDKFKTARAKLYYVRDKVGKDAKMKSLLTQEEKGIDLLEMAISLATKAQDAHAKANLVKEGVKQEEVKQGEVTQQEQAPETPEAQENNEQQEEAQK